MTVGSFTKMLLTLKTVVSLPFFLNAASVVNIINTLMMRLNAATQTKTKNSKNN